MGQNVLVIYTFTAVAHELAWGLYKGAEEARNMFKDMLSTGVVLRTYKSLGSPMKLFITKYIDSRPISKDDYGPGSRISLIKLVRFKKQEDLLQEGLKCYITEMLLLGIDMVSLVEFESKHLQDQRLAPGRVESPVHIIYDPVLGKREPVSKFRVIGFDYGPCVDEWRLWVSNPPDEWATDFWDMIDHPERAIPGARDDEREES